MAEEEKTQEKLSSSATITVEVQDLNDNNPQFDLESYTAVIPESSLPGQFALIFIFITGKSILCRGGRVSSYFWGKQHPD